MFDMHQMRDYPDLADPDSHRHAGRLDLHIPEDTSHPIDGDPGVLPPWRHDTRFALAMRLAIQNN